MRSTSINPKHNMVVGKPPIVLQNEYDSNQMWFEFMRGTIFTRIPELKLELTDDVHDLEKMIARQRDHRYKFHLSKVCKFETNQYILPIDQLKSLSKVKFIQLRECNYPGWDTDPEGKILNLKTKLNIKSVEEFREWASEHLMGMFYISQTKIFTQYLEDYMLIRLKQ